MNRPAASRRDAALAAFWTDHPLCTLYRWRNGKLRDGFYVAAASFSLRELIRFTEQLSDSDFAQVMQHRR